MFNTAKRFNLTEKKNDIVQINFEVVIEHTML